MPDRVVRADIVTMDSINSLSWAAEVFYRRLMSIVDDYGRYEATPALIRAYCYPKKLDRVSESDVIKWLSDCSVAGAVRLYTVNNKDYLQIEEFRQRLRTMKSKFPAPPDDVSRSRADADIYKHPTTAAVICQQAPSIDGLKRNESETESETKILSPKGDNEADASPPDNFSVYKQMKKNKKTIVEFIRLQKPLFIEPYVDVWNLFAQEKGLSQVTKISEQRRRKFRVRIKESSFDFIEILKKAGQSSFLLSGKWFCFDWLIENESNYLKVIEGNYDSQVGDLKNTVIAKEKSTGQNFNDNHHYLYNRFVECNGKLDERLIEPDLYDQLIVRNAIPVGFMDKQKGATPEEKKRKSVIAFFEYQKNEPIPQNHG